MATPTMLDKSAIRQMVLKIRHLLEDDIAAVLRQYGLYADRDWLLSDTIRTDLQIPRARMEAAMQPEFARIRAIQKDEGSARQAAAHWYIREVAFTYLNRLVGLKCMEARSLFSEVIQTREEYGGRSLYHRDHLDIHPELMGRADDGLIAALESACREITQQIRLLFDPDSSSSVVWPRYAALLQVIGCINALPLDYWREDEIIGWIYQFYNAEEKPAIRKRGKPTLPIEVAIINQFFTPRWIVKYLVDNTLGRLWLEMHPNSSRVRAKCDYLVPEPAATSSKNPRGERLGESDAHAIELDSDSPINNPTAAPRRAPKLPQAIKLIDPACGTMHFGYYAFEVFTAIYQDARELGFAPAASALNDADIPLAILRSNLHGVDIDLRAVQLAGLSLYLKARVALREAGVTDAQSMDLPWHVNLVCADARLPANGLREEFVRQYEDDRILQKAWRELFNEMGDIAQVGSLLRVEERFNSIIREYRPPSIRLSEIQQGYLPGAEPPVRQLTLADVTQPGDWTPHRSVSLMFDHLREFARAALDAADVNAQLFAAEAEKTLGLLDILMQSYHVVLMNPPYGDQQTDALRNYLNRLYPDTKIDSGISFVRRGIELARDTQGYVGALTPSSFMYLSSFKTFRKDIVSGRSHMPCMLDLGEGVLDNATIRTAAFALCTSEAGSLDNFSLFWNLSRTDVKDKRFFETLRMIRTGTIPQDVYITKWHDFRESPTYNLVYSLPPSVLRQFTRFGPLDRDVANTPDSPKIADVKVGLQTGNDELFVRYFWEVSKNPSIWRAFSKGGDYSPYYRDFELLVNWENDGYRIRNLYDEHGRQKSRPQNANFYGREGLTYPATSRQGLGAHYMPSGTIISVKGSGIYPTTLADPWYLLALLNSDLFYAFIKTFTPDREHQVGMLARLPIVPAREDVQRQLTERAHEIYETKAAWDTGNEISSRFAVPWLMQSQGHKLIREFDLQSALAEVELKESEANVRVQSAHSEINQLVYDLYEISKPDQELVEHELGKRPPIVVWPQMEGRSLADKRREHVRRLLSYLLKEALSTDSGGLLPLVEGAGRTTAIVRLRAAMEARFGEVSALKLEDDARRELGKPITSWLTDDFVDWHSELYEHRPIVWQLISERGAFSALLYYHKLDQDTLQKVRAVCLAPALRRAEQEGRRALEIGDLQAASIWEARVDEFRIFDTKLARIIASGYTPVIDDGVKQNILPLQEAGVVRLKKPL